MLTRTWTLIAIFGLVIIFFIPSKIEVLAIWLFINTILTTIFFIKGGINPVVESEEEAKEEYYKQVIIDGAKRMAPVIIDGVKRMAPIGMFLVKSVSVLTIVYYLTVMAMYSYDQYNLDPAIKLYHVIEETTCHVYQEGEDRNGCYSKEYKKIKVLNETVCKDIKSKTDIVTDYDCIIEEYTK